MEPCFAALERQNYRDFDILVVDNGSEDGSAQWLREREIPTLFMGENTGFSGAVNAGIRAVSTPYVILLNNDTEPFPDYVGELVRCMDRFPDVFFRQQQDDPAVPQGPDGRRGGHVQHPGLGLPAGGGAARRRLPEGEAGLCRLRRSRHLPERGL